MEELVKLFFGNYWQNLEITAAVHYFLKQPPEVFCKKMCSLKVCKYHRKIPVLGPVFKSCRTWSLKFFTKKLQHRCFPVKFAKLLRIPILKNICERLLLYLHYNSHDHFHFHHFHYHLYHCKIHLYRLRIVLTIPLDCNIIPCLFQLNFVFFLPAYIFL